MDNVFKVSTDVYQQLVDVSKKSDNHWLRTLNKELSVINDYYSSREFIKNAYNKWMERTYGKNTITS